MAQNGSTTKEMAQNGLDDKEMAEFNFLRAACERTAASRLPSNPNTARSNGEADPTLTLIDALHTKAATKAKRRQKHFERTNPGKSCAENGAVPATILESPRKEGSPGVTNQVPTQEPPTAASASGLVNGEPSVERQSSDPLLCDPNAATPQSPRAKSKESVQKDDSGSQNQDGSAEMNSRQSSQDKAANGASQRDTQKSQKSVSLEFEEDDKPTESQTQTQSRKKCPTIRCPGRRKEASHARDSAHSSSSGASGEHGMEHGKHHNKSIFDDRWIYMEEKAAQPEGAYFRKWRCKMKEKQTLALKAEEAATLKTKEWGKFDLFFGSFVIFNGLLMGVKIDKGISMSPTHEWMVDNTFLSIFLLELLLRFFFLGVKEMLKDSWTYFDVLIIGISVIDTFLLSAIPPFWEEFERRLEGGETRRLEEGGFPSASILRALRLFRLARLVRLFRLFKTLWVLVSGIFLSLRTLFWTMLVLAIVMYVYAIILVELVGKDEDFLSDPEIEDQVTPLTRLLPAMWTLTKLATFDGWVYYVLPIVKKKSLLLIFMFSYLAFAGLGLMNLVVGIMFTSAMAVTQQDEEIESYTQQVNQHKALLFLRDHLHQATDVDHPWTWKAVQKEIANNSPLQKVLTKGLVTPDQLEHAWGALSIFTERGHNAWLTADELIEACKWNSVGSDIRKKQLDIIECECLLHSMTDGLQKLEKNLIEATLALECSLLRSNPWNDKAGPKHKSALFKLFININQTRRYLQQFHTGFKDEDDVERAEGEEDEDLNEPEGKIEDEDLEDMAVKIFGKFDMFFGIFLMINSLLIGVQVDDQEAEGANSTMWFCLDNVFTLIFTGELVLRMLLFNQVYNDRDVKLKFGFVPKIPKEKKKMVECLKKGWRKFKYDPYGIFDVFIVGVCLVDLYIFSWAAENFDPAVMTVIRFIRLMKVARITRCFKLTAELFLLLCGILASFRAVIWACTFLMVILYMAGIVVTVTVGKAAAKSGASPELVEIFGSVDRSMFALLRLATLSRWVDILGLMWNNGFKVWATFCLFITVLNNLGIMNLVVGIMCESAMQVTQKLAIQDRQRFLRQLKEALKQVKIRIMIDNGLSAGDDTVTRVQMAGALTDESLVNAFKKAQLQLADVWEIFDCMSQASAEHAAADSVDLSDFVAACVSYDLPVRAFELVAIRTQMLLVEERLFDVYSRVRRLVAEARAALFQLSEYRQKNKDERASIALKDKIPVAQQIIKGNERQIALAIEHLEEQVAWGPQMQAHERDHLKHDPDY